MLKWGSGEERKSEGVHVTWKPKEDYGGISKKETKEKGVDGEKGDDQYKSMLQYLN